MRGGRRAGAGRKKKPDHLRRELVTIRLPQWMISQLKNKGEIDKRACPGQKKCHPSTLATNADRSKKTNLFLHGG